MLDTNPVKVYSREQLMAVLEKLVALGLSEQQQKELNGMTIQQLDDMVNGKNLV